MLRRIRRFFKSFLPRTLFWRSLLILVLPIFLVQIITTYIFFDRHWQKMGDRLAVSVANEIRLVSEMVEQDDSDINVLYIKQLLENPLDITFQYEREGQIESRFQRSKWFESPGRKNYIGRTLSRAFDDGLGGRLYSIYVQPNQKWVEIKVQLSRGVLNITLPERRVFSSSGYVVLLWMAGSSIILIFIATLFMRNQIRPIRRLAIAAEKFGKGRDVPFFRVEGAREVRQAARAFVEMKDRLQRQIQQRTTMLAGVSHDLRTPLTRIKLQLAMMGDGADVADLKNDVVDMERMIGAYLDFARGQGGEEPVRTNLSSLIEQVVKTANRDKESAFSDVPQDISLLLRPVAFERCLNNLVGNALKYGTKAWITVRRFEDMIEIWIDDDGPGIPEDQYEDVFKPFFRGESSRNSKTGGVGLGLPIVQDVVLSHGGQVWFDKSPNGGLRVIIDLPV